MGLTSLSRPPRLEKRPLKYAPGNPFFSLLTTLGNRDKYRFTRAVRRVVGVLPNSHWLLSIDLLSVLLEEAKSKRITIGES